MSMSMSTNQTVASSTAINGTFTCTVSVDPATQTLHLACSSPSIGQTGQSQDPSSVSGASVPTGQTSTCVGNTDPTIANQGAYRTYEVDQIIRSVPRIAEKLRDERRYRY